MLTAAFTVMKGTAFVVIYMALPIMWCMYMLIRERLGAKSRLLAPLAGVNMNVVQVEDWDVPGQQSRHTLDDRNQQDHGCVSGASQVVGPSPHPTPSPAPTHAPAGRPAPPVPAPSNISGGSDHLSIPNVG